MFNLQPSLLDESKNCVYKLAYEKGLLSTLCVVYVLEVIPPYLIPQIYHLHTQNDRQHFTKRFGERCFNLILKYEKNAITNASSL